MKNELKVVSVFGLISSVFFMLFSFTYRVLLPFGDEPDFTVRAPRVVDGEHLFWSPYSLFHSVIENLNVVSYCKIEASPMSAFAHIDSASCSESLEQIVLRFLIVVIVSLPLLYAITFRKSFVLTMHFLNFKLSVNEWQNRLDVLSLSLLFPSIIYYLGLFAEEQFILVLSLFIFLFWNFRILVLVVFGLIMSIDLGNSIVVLVFILFGWFFTYVTKKLSIKTSVLIMFGFMLFVLLIGFTFLTFLENISFLASKAEAMYNKGLGFHNKYPTILRPVVTYMSGIFMMPSGIKVIVLYIVYGPLFIWMWFKLNIYGKRLTIKEKKKFQLDNTMLLSSITTILFFVFLFPDYGFAKYYVFIIPFILYSSIYVFNKKNIITLFMISNIIIFIHLILYRF